jgi:hypothetical protein
MILLLKQNLMEAQEHVLIFVKHADSRKRRAKDRYLMTTQIFTVRFATADLTYFPLPLI